MEGLFYMKKNGHGLVASLSGLGEDIKNKNLWGIINVCKNLHLNGYSDWRLPTDKEFDLMFRLLVRYNLSISSEEYSFMNYNNEYMNNQQNNRNYARPIRSF